MSVNYTVADLKPRILENIDKLEYPAAYTFCQKALELEPHNAEVLEITGQVELELEHFELAKKVSFQRHIVKIERHKMPTLILLCSTCWNPSNLSLKPATVNICTWVNYP